MTYITRKKPTAILAVANHGLASGLPRYEEIVAQSMPKEPIPRPFNPEPSCWTKMDLGANQHTQEKDVNVLKRYPGRT